MCVFAMPRGIHGEISTLVCSAFDESMLPACQPGVVEDTHSIARDVGWLKCNTRVVRPLQPCLFLISCRLSFRAVDSHLVYVSCVVEFMQRPCCHGRGLAPNLPRKNERIPKERMNP